MDGDYRRGDASCATDGGDDNVADVVDNNNEDDGFYCLFYRVDPLFVVFGPYDPIPSCVISLQCISPVHRWLFFVY